MEREVVELFEAAKKAANAAAGASSDRADVVRCTDALKQLQTLPVTSEVLISTQVGKRLRSLTKHPTKEIGAMANDLLDVWKKVVMEEAARKKNGVTDRKSSVKTELSKSDTLKVETCESTSLVRIEKTSKTEAVKVEKVDQKATVEVEQIRKEEQQVYNAKKPIAPPKMTTLLKCNNDLRDKVHELLLEALSNVANEADEDIKDEVSGCDPIRVAVSVETAMFEKFGLSNGANKMKYRSIMFNIKDPKNPDLRRKVLLGEVKPERLVHMSAEEMASDERQRENKQIKDKALFDCERGGPPKATTDQFKCGRCGQRKCTYYQMQTRSADEPMTTYVTCVNCNNHWKFC